MGNVIYTGNNKIQTQNNSPVVLFDSGKITFDNDDYEWYDDETKKPIDASYEKFQPYRIDGYAHSSSKTGWYKNYYSGIIIPITLETFLSYPEITITTLFTPRNSEYYLFLSNKQNIDEVNNLFLEVTLNNGSGQRYSIQQFTNLGTNLYLSKNLLADSVGSEGSKTALYNSIYDINLSAIDLPAQKFLYNLKEVEMSTNLYIKNFKAIGYKPTSTNCATYPIGLGYKDLRIIITGR